MTQGQWKCNRTTWCLCHSFRKLRITLWWAHLRKKRGRTPTSVSFRLHWGPLDEDTCTFPPLTWEAGEPRSAGPPPSGAGLLSGRCSAPLCIVHMGFPMELPCCCLLQWDCHAAAVASTGEHRPTLSVSAGGVPHRDASQRVLTRGFSGPGVPLEPLPLPTPTSSWPCAQQQQGLRAALPSAQCLAPAPSPTSLQPSGCTAFVLSNFAPFLNFVLWISRASSWLQVLSALQHLERLPVSAFWSPTGFPQVSAAPPPRGLNGLGHAQGCGVPCVPATL